MPFKHDSLVVRRISLSRLFVSNVRCSTTQTGRIQIFDQLSARFIKTASSSTAKSFVSIAWFTVTKTLHLIAARMTKNVRAFSLSLCIAGSCLFVTQYNVLDILGGWGRVKLRNA